LWLLLLVTLSRVCQPCLISCLACESLVQTELDQTLIQHRALLQLALLPRVEHCSRKNKRHYAKLLFLRKNITITQKQLKLLIFTSSTPKHYNYAKTTKLLIFTSSTQKHENYAKKTM